MRAGVTLVETRTECRNAKGGFLCKGSPESLNTFKEGLDRGPLSYRLLSKEVILICEISP